MTITHAWLYDVYTSMLKQRRLTAWLKPWEGEPPAKHGRQDTESDSEAASDPSATLDSALLSSLSDAPTRSCFDPGRLSLSSGSHIARSRLESYSKPYDIGRIAEFARDLNREDMFSVLNNVYKPPADLTNIS